MQLSIERGKGEHILIIHCNILVLEGLRDLKN